MVSCHLESDVEVSPRPTRGINVVAMASMSQILMVALLFENHFVVELLWPRRERRARMNPLVVSNIFNALLTIFKIRTRCRVLTRFMFEVNVVAMASMSQVLNFFDLLYCIVDTKTKPWHDFVFSSLVLYEKEECGKFRVRCRVLTRFMFEVNVVAMASMSQTQFQKEYKKFEVRCRVLTRFMFEVNVVAMASMSQTQISL